MNDEPQIPLINKIAGRIVQHNSRLTEQGKIVQSSFTLAIELIEMFNQEVAHIQQELAMNKARYADCIKARDEAERLSRHKDGIILGLRAEIKDAREPRGMWDMGLTPTENE